MLSDYFTNKIISTIESRVNKKIKDYQLIYSGNRDGLNGQTFWNKVNYSSNLLMIFKSRCGYIFGAFSPC